MTARARRTGCSSPPRAASQRWRANRLGAWRKGRHRARWPARDDLDDLAGPARHFRRHAWRRRALQRRRRALGRAQFRPRLQGCLYRRVGRRSGRHRALCRDRSPPRSSRAAICGQSWSELPVLRPSAGHCEYWTFPELPHIAHIKMMVVRSAHATTHLRRDRAMALLKTEDGGQSWRELAD